MGAAKAMREHLRWVFFPTVLALSIVFPCASVCAQTVQFLPEIDGHLKLNPIVRVYFEAKEDRDGGDPTQATLGPSMQLYLKPLVRLRNISAFDLDDAKQRPLVVETGYRSITAPNASPENRLLTAVTFHLPAKSAILITDRNRADLDWKGGAFSWRYRNRLTLERTFRILSYHLIPYASVEPYYESQYEKWSTTSLYAGCLFPVGKHVQFSSYYEHDNNTGKRPNQQVNSIGLALYLYFSVEGK